MVWLITFSFLIIVIIAFIFWYIAKLTNRVFDLETSLRDSRNDTHNAIGILVRGDEDEIARLKMACADYSGTRRWTDAANEAVEKFKASQK